MNTPSSELQNRDNNPAVIGNKKTIANTGEVSKKFDVVANNLSNLTIEFNALRNAGKQQDAAVYELEKSLTEATKENELLLGQLLLTQEELEQATARSTSLSAHNDAYKDHLMRVLEKHPEHWCFDSIEVTKKTTSSQNFTAWEVTNTIILDKFYPSLRFETTLINGIMGFIIKRTNSTSPLTRWPDAFSDNDELPLIPTHDQSGTNNNAIFSSLSPSDWSLVNELARRLMYYLDQSDHSHFDSREKKALKKGLESYLNILRKLPIAFRYERARLLNKISRDNYYALEIELENPQLGEYTWPNLRYRIATVEGTTRNFEQHPRLEFHSPCNALSSWFPESSDEHGSRLELRFSAPDLMDTRVWNKLTGKDQILIAALISSASSQLSLINSQSGAEQLNITSWISVCETIRRIFTTKFMQST